MEPRPVPPIRLAARNDAPLRADGTHVVYWMTAARRTRGSFALDRAVGLAREHGRPLLVLEALRCAYPHASDRLHRFVLDGMADNAARFAAAGVTYHPYVEPTPGAGRGLLAALAADAVAVVTDEFPCSFLPRMLDAAARQVRVRLEAVDGNGLLPLRAAERVHGTAHSFRRLLQRALPIHLAEGPSADPLAAAAGLPRAILPDGVAARWPAADPALLRGEASLASIAIDHSVAAAPFRGGETEGERTLARFVGARLTGYDIDRGHPDEDGTSGLSPYLHFGHVAAHQAFAAVAAAEGWTAPAVAPKATGSRAGWWGMSAPAEAFLDQIVTWRELGLASSFRTRDFDSYAGVPAWARATLDRHRGDARPFVYSPDEFERAATHDAIWNAAQRQLVREGRLHNSARMLWGKKVLEWSATPEEAFTTLVRLNDRYAVDGRDPNSYSGIAWCFGRYDRPWGPERAVFGTVRFMSTAAARRKLRLRSWLASHAE